MTVSMARGLAWLSLIVLLLAACTSQGSGHQGDGYADNWSTNSERGNGANYLAGLVKGQYQVTFTGSEACSYQVHVFTEGQFYDPAAPTINLEFSGPGTQRSETKDFPRGGYEVEVRTTPDSRSGCPWDVTIARP